MKKSNHFPAVRVLKGPGRRFRAVAGFKVTGILSRALRGKRETSPAEELAHVYTAHVSLMRSLAAWPQNVTVAMNIVTQPNVIRPFQGQLAMTLFLSVLASERGDAVADVLGRAAIFSALLSNFLGAVELTPIDQDVDLDTAVGSSGVARAVSIQRRSEALAVSTLSEPEGRPIGFFLLDPLEQSPGERGGAVQEIPFLRPWNSPPADLSSITEALLDHPAPLRIHVRMNPTTVPQTTFQRLQEGLKTCEELLLGPWGYQTVFRMQVTALRTAIVERLYRLKHGVFRGAVVLAAPVDLDEALVGAVGQSISGHPMASDTPLPLAGGWAAVRIDPEAAMDLDCFPEDEPFTPEEAACAFRIPHPQKQDCAGLPVRSFRTTLGSLPQRAPSPRNSVSLGVNAHHGHEQPVFVAGDDRMQHTFVLGQTGTGKSTLLLHMILQDLRQGRGLCLLDPHGELLESILHQYPDHRREDLILVDLLDRGHPVPLNILKWRTVEERDFIIDELFVTVDRFYDMKATGGPLFEAYFRGMLRLLMGDRPREGFTPTILEFRRLFQDEDFRRLCVRDVQDPEVSNFLSEIEEAGGDVKLANVSPYVTSKLNRFVMDSATRRIFGQEDMAFDFREVMDTGKVVLINLGKGRFGSVVSSVLAGQIVARFAAAAMARAEVAPEARRDFFLYVDEFQNVGHDSFVELLAEARKYRLGLVMANQFADQLERSNAAGRESTLSAVLGNVGTIIAFRLGIKDAGLLEQVFQPNFARDDLINLPNHHCYVSLRCAQPKPTSFNLQTVRTDWKQNSGRVERLRQTSRQKYARSAQEVEEMIRNRSERIQSLLEGEPRIRNFAATLFGSARGDEV